MEDFTLPDRGLEADLIIEKLMEIASHDADPHSGRLWSYVYEHGEPRIREIAERAYRLMLWRNMLDPTVFPSVLRLEREVVGIVAALFNAPEGYTGNFTSGGTESNFLAVKAARERYLKRKGISAKTPELVMPATAHPSLAKAAEILGIRVKIVGVDDGFRAGVEGIKEAISDSTAIVALSAPNYPTGAVDPVREIAEYIGEKNIWLHVDACLGFILPFLRDLGEEIPDYDFSVESVTSISVDLHKYGYAPRGASVILYRNREYRLGSVFVYSRWPGYPLVNIVFQSSRTAGPLAAAWVTLKALGREGYIRLAKYVLEARNQLVKGLQSWGFKLLSRPAAGVFAVTHDELDLVALAMVMHRRGWHLQVQPGSKHLGFPMSLHFTVTPVHRRLVETFLRELEQAIEKAKNIRLDEVGMLVDVLKGMSKEEIRNAIPLLVRAIGGRDLKGDTGIIPIAVHNLDPGIVEMAFKLIANEVL